MPKLARQQLARQWTEECQRDAASGKIGTTEALEILEIEAGATLEPLADGLVVNFEARTALELHFGHACLNPWLLRDLSE
jgi:hypothetical protein